MRCHLCVEVYHRYKAQHRADKVYHVKREVMGYYSACGDTYADTYVPCGEVCACCCGALVVGSKVYIKCVHCREYNAESDTE